MKSVNGGSPILGIILAKIFPYYKNVEYTNYFGVHDAFPVHRLYLLSSILSPFAAEKHA
jgi:hypothetical protein